MQNKKQILICLAGKSPQIVTEAIYCLVVRKSISLSDILIITTEECRSELLGELTPNFKQMKQYYPQIAFNLNKDNIISGEEELVSQAEASSLTRLIFDTVRISKQTGYSLHCFISGGRKTMSVDLAIALTIYGDESDRLYHVIASPNFAEKKQYFPQDDKESEELFLIEKPLVKLNYKNNLVENDIQIPINEVVKNVQYELDSSVKLPVLEINITERKVRVGDIEFSLQPLVFAVYLFFAKQGKFIKGGKNFSRPNAEKLWNLYQKISPSYGHSKRVASSAFEKDRIDFDLIQKSISVIRNKFSEILSEQHISEFFSVSTEGTYADKRYGIRLPKSKIRITK